jgi:hypothetical protein
MRRPSVGHSQLINHNRQYSHSMSTPHTSTPTHTFFTNNGFNLGWSNPTQIKLASGKKRMVQNYVFKDTVENHRLIDFCVDNIDKLESLSYTFSDPNNCRNLGFYRISYYYDPVETKVPNTGARQEILQIQREILEVSKHVKRQNQQQIVNLSQRLADVAMKV